MRREYRRRARNLGGALLAVALAVTGAVAPPSAAGAAGPAVLSVNAGGSASGAFVADAYFTGGTAATHANPIDVSGVSAAAPVDVY
ncbi:hypothetical protein ACFO0M_27805 [Micromonospora mangrovi]|uniref:Uncharacterized protein n=2 Tax=Micromonospora TaxID=1873 RepID=A0AAU7MDM5_9ACTN